MTKTQEKVWDLAVEVYGVEHDPYNTNTLTSVWRGWHQDKSGNRVFGWHASFMKAFDKKTVFLGQSVTQVKNWAQTMKEAIDH